MRAISISTNGVPPRPPSRNTQVPQPPSSSGGSNHARQGSRGGRDSKIVISTSLDEDDLDLARPFTISTPLSASSSNNNNNESQQPKDRTQPSSGSMTDRGGSRTRGRPCNPSNSSSSLSQY
jgi:hypothetical protein